MNEVKKIAKILDEAECVEDALFVDFDGMVKALVNAGYGDTNQAKIEVLEKLKERIYKAEHPYACVINELLSEEHKAILDELLAEVIGE